MSKQPVTGRSPSANAEGTFGQPGMVWDHHAVNCTCRRCRRLDAAERRRKRRRVTREVLGDST
jgi:hypothetical protein